MSEELPALVAGRAMWDKMLSTPEAGYDESERTGRPVSAGSTMVRADQHAA